jgi:hypothetical protein
MPPETTYPLVVMAIPLEVWIIIVLLLFLFFVPADN